jgi:phage-related protein
MTEMRPLKWLGNSLDNLKEFPKDVQKDMGDDLQTVQWGSTPASAKHFKGVGSGVYELVEDHDKNAYRAVRSSSARKFMFCMPFRRNLSKASKRHRLMLN